MHLCTCPVMFSCMWIFSNCFQMFYCRSSADVAWAWEERSSSYRRTPGIILPTVMGRSTSALPSLQPPGTEAAICWTISNSQRSLLVFHYTRDTNALNNNPNRLFLLSGIHKCNYSFLFKSLKTAYFHSQSFSIKQPGIIFSYCFFSDVAHSDTCTSTCINKTVNQTVD